MKKLAVSIVRISLDLMLTDYNIIFILILGNQKIDFFYPILCKFNDVLLRDIKYEYLK